MTQQEMVGNASGTQRAALLDRIRGSFEQLRKSERAVAQFVLEQPNDVLNISIAELAYRVGVSQPTVARFATAIGFSGYKEFKLHLAQSLATGVQFVHQDVSPDDAVEDVAPKVFDRAVAALVAARNHLDRGRFALAVEMLSKARRVEFYGIGNSGIVASDAQHKFFRFGFFSVAYADPHVQGMAATLLQAGDVVVAISASGRTADLIRSCQLARDAGADVIAITASGSELARVATVALGVDQFEDPDVYAPMTSRLVHLTIVDALSVGVALVGGEALLERLERTKQTLRDRRVRGFLE